NLGDLIELEYIATGPNQNQNSYSISKLGQLPYFSVTAPPAAGITFSQTVDCGPPPAQPQDCAGGVTLCSSQSITTTQTNSGQLADLNPSNQGCLSGGESMGTWYFFSPQTSGTIGFTITPANGTDDYDFALWGPYTEATCPTQPPLRCSWNAPPSYEVGLGNGATDLSEDAWGDGWVKTIDALAGEVYVLYVDNWSTSGQAFTLSWQLSGGSSLDCTTLPVELLSLEAFARDPAIDVQWATATEQQSSHFNVQRSADNVHFSTIGTMPAAGNSQFRTDYLFVDQHPFRGVNYYRLEQVDHDGTTMRTYTVAATLFQGSTNPSIFPNPAADELSVVFPEPVQAGTQLQVLDATGRVISSLQAATAPGLRTALVPLDGIAKGWYQLRILNPGGALLHHGVFLKQ
ncbi:MAG TPA: T9SS type A sorting domain-containing protein, partial [Flavobacteriales bacterium]|nr:T9SS type A sorting domain-containing protein [Flavobacteriales bacterium]